MPPIMPLKEVKEGETREKTLKVTVFLILPALGPSNFPRVTESISN